MTTGPAYDVRGCQSLRGYAAKRIRMPADLPNEQSGPFSTPPAEPSAGLQRSPGLLVDVQPHYLVSVRYRLIALCRGDDNGLPGRRWSELLRQIYLDGKGVALNGHLYVLHARPPCSIVYSNVLGAQLPSEQVPRRWIEAITGHPETGSKSKPNATGQRRR